MAKSKSPRRAGASGHAGNPGTQVSKTERQRLIAESAYYRAQTRGFQGGNPNDDWLAAEREIGRMLPSPQQQKQELAAFEKLRADVRQTLADARELSADTIRQALDEARTRLKQLGEHTADTVDKAAAGVEKEMVAAAQRVGARLENLSERTVDLFNVWGERGAQFVTRAAGAIGDWLQQAGVRIGPHAYRTGDVAASGTLECTACGEKVILETAAHVPLCPNCRKTEFRRV